MKKLPKFSRQSGIPQNAGKSEEEEARFWDTHSPLDYPDEFTEVKEPFEFTNGYMKKSQKVSRIDLEKARESKKDYICRVKGGSYYGKN